MIGSLGHVDLVQGAGDQPAMSAKEEDWEGPGQDLAPPPEYRQVQVVFPATPPEAEFPGRGSHIVAGEVVKEEADQDLPGEYLRDATGGNHRSLLVSKVDVRQGLAGKK